MAAAPCAQLVARQQNRAWLPAGSSPPKERQLRRRAVEHPSLRQLAGTALMQ